VEVIYPALDGKIYFLDLETGKPTRDVIDVGFTMKGTAWWIPEASPVLYRMVLMKRNKLTEFKFLMFILIDQKMIYKIIGRDPMAFRSWAPLTPRLFSIKNTDTLFEAAENGLVYRVKLNTKFDKRPEASTYLLKSPSSATRIFNPELGIENSPAFYKNYMYFCDNGGTFMCLDINTMKPVWVNHVGDDTDSSTVIEETDEGVFLYTANQVDKRSQESKATENCNIRKFNALTGELIWQKDYPCIYNFYLNGGSLGTPLIGKNDIADLIIFPICFTGSTSDGKLVALNKKTGEEVWVRKLNAYSCVHRLTS
jgi:hypothetical protein